MNNKSKEVLNDLCTTYTGFPLRLDNLEKWEGIFQSGRFVLFAKMDQAFSLKTKYLKNTGGVGKNTPEKSANIVDLQIFRSGTMLCLHID